MSDPGPQMTEPTTQDLLAAIESARASLTVRLDDVRTKTGAILDELTTHFSATERADAKAISTRDLVEALSREVSGIHRQLNRLRAEMGELRDKENRP